MPQPSGADIKLGADEFVIDRSVPNHYIHRFENMVPETQEVPGIPDGKRLPSDTLMWAIDDWAGGEGNRQWYSDEYDVYNVGYELNPRIRGQLTGRPNRTRTQITASDCRDRTGFAVGDRAAWMFGGIEMWYHRSGTTWDAATSGNIGLSSLSANYKISAASGDDRWVYYSAWHSGSSGSRVTRRLNQNGDDDTIEAEATGKLPYIGMAVSNGKLYCWTGRKLYEMDIDQSMPLASDKIRKVYDTGVEVSTSSLQNSHYWGECVATENSVIMWFATDGQTQVYEYRKGVGRPIWQGPYGATVKGSTYQNGIVYFSGHWGGDSVQNGYGFLYAIELATYRVIPLKTPRRIQGTNLQLQTLAPSYGGQILCVGEHSGRVFVYDQDTDGFSMVDDLGGTNTDSLTFTDNDNRVGGALTWGNQRLISIYRPGAAAASTEEYQIVTYDPDEPADRETGLNTTNYTTANAYFESPLWDYDYPWERKNLVAVHLTFEPMVSGQFIDVSYSLDGASFVALTQVTSATSGASLGRVVIPISTASSTKSFHQLAFRCALTSNTGVATPILCEEWELVIRLKDEESRARPSNRESRGSKIRDVLEATVEAGAVVTFLDGYRYSKQGPQSPKLYSTHTVVIQKIEDEIEKPGEGACRVLLVATSEAT
jgi:hypothetical protein